MIKESIIKAYKDKFLVKKFIPGVSLIPVSGKVFDEQEIIKMVEAVLEGHWTEGKYAKEFEKRLANFLGLNFCTVVNSGSSANLLALTALTSYKLPKGKRLKKGDEVITTAVGFPTTVNPIIQNGLTPVFIDVELGSYNAPLETVKKAITKKTRVVFMAHTLGNAFQAEEIRDFCDKNNIWLIEDNCDALGSKYSGKFTGSFGHLSTCSFYPAHHITLVEGGAVLTNDPLLNEIVRSLRDWGRDCVCPTGVDNVCGRRFGKQLGDLPYGYDHKYTYSEIGYNLKITDIQAALGLAQLEKLPEFIRRRKENFRYLYEAFEDFRGCFILPSWDANAEPSWFGFPLTVKTIAGFKRDDLLRFLNSRKIGTRLIFAGNIVRQPYFRSYKIKHRIFGKLENADEVMRNAFWIGVYPGLNKEMLDYVIESFKDFKRV